MLRREKDMSAKFFVVGGEYADTTFTRIADGKTLETHGPFGESEAHAFWRGITGKTVDNAMVRYFVKPEEEAVDASYYVYGGEYADTRFTELAPGEELEVHGPFSKARALDVWRSLTGKTVDHAMVRYDIASESELPPDARSKL